MNNPPMSKVFIRVWLVLLTLITTCVAIYGAGEYHYSEDEALHIGIAQAPTLQDVLQYSLYETHPPLGHIIRHYWMQISGTLQFVRDLSLIFGLALISLYYCIGKLLNGEWTGFCAAILVAFSHGCLIQSYVARNYSIFLFFISMSFYFYLLWRNDTKKSSILYYTLFAIAASLTHFSAILAIFTVVAYEIIYRYLNKSTPLASLLWVAANSLIAVMAIAVYYFWATKGTVIGGFYMGASMTVPLMAALIIVYPINSIMYMMPSIAIIPLIIFSLLLPPVRNDKKLQQFLSFAGIAFVIGTLLVATQRYYPSGTRHGIWTLPFIIPAIAWIISATVKELQKFVAQKTLTYSTQIVAMIILLSGLLLYSSDSRFAVNSEYQMKEKDWQAMVQYLKTLNKKSVIIGARDDIILLQNTYPYLGDAPFTGKIMAITIPYSDTHIITNPVARRFSTADVLISTLKEANDNHALDDVDTLVFMKTIWETPPDSLNPMPYLFTCNDILKKIMSFPDFSYPDLPPNINITDEEMKMAPVAFLSVSKKEFFDEVIAPVGKAHHCLAKAKNDTAKQ